MQAMIASVSPVPARQGGAVFQLDMYESIVTEEQHEVLVRRRIFQRFYCIRFFGEIRSHTPYTLDARQLFQPTMFLFCLWGAGATRSAVCLPAFVVAQFELLERAIGL